LVQVRHEMARRRATDDEGRDGARSFEHQRVLARARRTRARVPPSQVRGLIDYGTCGQLPDESGGRH
jgi:hypothetical protein